MEAAVQFVDDDHPVAFENVPGEGEEALGSGRLRLQREAVALAAGAGPVNQLHLFLLHAHIVEGHVGSSE